MALEDEIGNFSKRREVEVVSKKVLPTKEESDEDDYDEWDDDEYEDDEDDGAYDSLDFTLYELDELAELNREIEELEELLSPWWKKLRVIFSKETFGKIGIVEYKKKSLFSDDTFEELYIENVEESLEELKIFENSVQKSYLRRVKRDGFKLLLYLLLAYWTGWNVIWYFLIGWSLASMIKPYLNHKKEKAWLVKAERFIETQDGHSLNKEREEKKSSTLEDVMAFNDFVSKEESEHWSIKFYDAVANLFRRKK